MNRLLLFVRWVSVCGMLVNLVGGDATAGDPPGGGNSSIPSWITLVGTHWDPALGRLVPQGDNAAGGDSRDPYAVIIVRDFTNNPVPDAEVVVSFENCDAQLCDYAVGEGEGSVSCSIQNGKVVARTDANGQVRLLILGSANAGPPMGGVQSPGAGSGPGATLYSCVEIIADGVILGHAQFNAWDLNGPLGGNGVSSLDESFAAGNALLFAGTGAYRTRSDFNRDGANSLSDVALLDGVRRLGLSSSGCPGSYCP